MVLWIGSDARSRILRQHSRTINNAVCLTSLQVNERTGGFNPSVIFQGKVMHRIGPISHTAGETPHYAQLYVLDSDMESTQRFANMNVPASLSRNQRNVLKQVLEIVQRCLHDVNPFIHDFKQIMEIPGSDLAGGKIVISAKGPASVCGVFINEKFNERSFQVEKFSVFSMIRLADRIVAKNGYELSFL